MDNNSKKKLLIMLIYGVIIVLIIFGIFVFVKPKPSCFDGKLNQGEVKIDCGGPCSPCEDEELSISEIRVEEKHFAVDGAGKYDAVIKVHNPNHDYGGASMKYEVVMKNFYGEELARKNGVSFILPRESKYIIETNFEADQRPTSVEMNILEVDWKKFEGYEKPALTIINKRFTEGSGGIYNEVYGVLRNESFFDFGEISMNIVLRSSSNEIVAVNKSKLMSVNSLQERDFRIVWPFDFGGDVSVIEIEAEADVYNSENFITKYLPKEKFQNYGR